MQFVDRMLEIQTSQQRIGRDLRGAEDVAAAVAFDFAECNQLSDTSVEVAPHPVVERAKQAIDEGANRNAHREDAEG
jgi:hypothetical protein